MYGCGVRAGAGLWGAGGEHREPGAPGDRAAAPLPHRCTPQKRLRGTRDRAGCFGKGTETDW